jgi:pimeloyl-ACP methyl ester carboxylesterase
MQAELPELRTIDIDGPIAFRRWDGPDESTFVLVHGLGGSHLSWLQVAPGLAGLGNVIAVDLPGYGWSPRARRGTGLMDQRRILSRVIADLATGKVILCGNSLGGAIVVLEAAVEPDAAAGLVLTSSVFPWVRGRHRPHPATMAAFAMYDMPVVGERFVQVRTRRVDPRTLVAIGFKMVAEDPASIPPEVVEMHVELARKRSHDQETTAAFIDTTRSMLRLGRRADAGARTFDHVTCPVLVLHGRRDRLVPAAFAEETLRTHPAWRGRIFPDLGHVPQMEAPGRWISEVADWYAEEIV